MSNRLSVGSIAGAVLVLVSTASFALDVAIPGVTPTALPRVPVVPVALPAPPALPIATPALPEVPVASSHSVDVPVDPAVPVELPEPLVMPAALGRRVSVSVNTAVGGAYLVKPGKASVGGVHPSTQIVDPLPSLPIPAVPVSVVQGVPATALTLVQGIPVPSQPAGAPSLPGLPIP